MWSFCFPFSLHFRLNDFFQPYMSKSFAAFRPLSHGQWGVPPAFRLRSHMLPKVHTFARWLDGVEEDTRERGPSHCSEGCSWLSSHPSLQGPQAWCFRGMRKRSQDFVANTARDQGLPTEDSLPPTPHNINLETRDELCMGSLKISWYSCKRDTSFNIEAKHLLYVFIVLKDNASKSPILVPE